jgi:hypothetical protein
MRFFAFGQEAEGFIAIGQVATGVIAIGQLATGVIAIGQVSRGVIAVGMVAFGVVSLGMLSFGLVFAAGMVGAGGRAGPGAILPLVPAPKDRVNLPTRTTLDRIRASGREGWLDVALEIAGGLPQLVHAGSPLHATLAPQLIAPATTHAQLRGRAVALVVPSGAGLEVRRLMAVPSRGLAGPIGAAFQIALLCVVAYAYWALVLVDLGDMVLGMGREILIGNVY